MTNLILQHRTAGPKVTRTALSCHWRVPVLAIAIHAALAVSSFAQPAPPPPLGPSSYRSDKIQIGVGVLTGFVKMKVAEIVSNANNEIHKQTSHVTVEALPLKVFSPIRVATRYTNRPNEYYVQLPIEIAIKVRIDLASDRTIYIHLNLNLSCEGWETGKGTVQIVAQADPPVVEGGNIVEEVIRVRDPIASK